LSFGTTFSKKIKKSGIKGKEIQDAPNLDEFEKGHGRGVRE